ncbi:hypothetical protein SAMN02745245_01586 [Anaerosphaera aminiphila DSM 21120]|uniref:Erythromycin esterase n=1 Tax=Anaerosphaera aminiphila DSM 21120 TaxID=1120995 RepID=A0A1M5TVS4_9FIRM|nr:hypothetical protein [Anaerosphaera aminiphila]SHH54761.1 hypothetical protein SAMN02745245_01586 [Anaerosphaera aminiphila DSM 21120]
MIKYKSKLLAVLTLITSLLLTSCSNENEVKNYIASVDTTYLNSQLVDETENFNKYNIYMVGETHGTVGTFITEFELAKYFNQYQNVNDLLIETGYCSGALLNEYIHTGNEKLLNIVMKSTKGTFAYSNESANFYKSLYKLNKTLPENKKINLHGVDVEHVYNEAGLYYLSTLIPSDTNIPKEISTYITQLNSTLDREKGKVFIENLNKNIKKYNTQYKELLGESYPEFMASLDNINQAIDFYKDHNFDIREQYFTKNVLEKYESINKKCLAIFGGEHTVLSESNNIGIGKVGKILAEKYGTDSGGVASISLEYYRSHNRKSEERAKHLNSASGIPLAKKTEKDISLFKLNLKDEDKAIQTLAKGQQYAILIKNSPATTPYSEK